MKSEKKVFQSYSHVPSASVPFGADQIAPWSRMQPLAACSQVATSRALGCDGKLACRPPSQVTL